MAPMKPSVFVLATLVLFSMNPTAASEITRTSIRQRRCNIGFCFAIDGSQSISARAFWRQTFLARQIINNIPNSVSASFAAVQYGVSNQVISELTSDRNLIRSELRDAEQLFSRRTFLSAGLNFCFSELFDVQGDRPVCRRSIIVVMGNGNGNIGANPVDRARLFEAEVRRGDVIAVEFGAGANSRQLREIGGRRDFLNARSTPIRTLAREIVRRFGM